MAKSLTKSSASLVAAGGNLAEAAALTATANAIIQDADSVGTALKTTSLRLRGTSVKVLEEEGLDSDGAVESTSKLRSQVLATSGVDILTDTGAYKSTYQILLEIAEVWDQITDDKARAGLLELLAGKRNSSVIAALLQNPEDLKAAYEDAMDAEGSALKENERYLDSIQGKIDQFNNATQAMWSNFLDADVVKFIVDLGTALIKAVDALGLLNSAILVFAGSKIIPWLLTSITGMNTFGESLKYIGMMMTSINGTGAALIPTLIAESKAAYAASAANGVLGKSLAALQAGFATLMATPLGWLLAAAAAIAAVVVVADLCYKSTAELTEELNGLKSELSDIRSELDAVNSELKTTNEHMAELLAKDKLTFEEQEELDRLRATNDELERRKRLLEDEDEIKSEQVGRKAAEVVGRLKYETLDDGWRFSNYSAEEDILLKIDKYKETKSKLDNASSLKEQEKYQKQLDKQSDIINKYIISLSDALEGVEYGDSEESDEALDYLAELQDIYGIARGSANAKTNAIKGLFNKDEFAETKTAIDGYVDALAKGDANAANSIAKIIKSNKDLVEDLEVRGLEAQDAIDYFTNLGSEANYATLEGKIAEMQGATSRLSELFSSGSGVDEDFIGPLTRMQQLPKDFALLFDENGKVSETAIAEYFQGTSEATRTEVAKLVQDIYDGKTSVENALKQFEIFSIQSSLDIYIAEVQTNFKDVFVDLEDADGLINTFEELGEAIGSAASALDTLNQAQAEMAYSGHVSIETALQLMEYTDDYGSVLEVVDGKLQLVEGAENNLIQARINAIKTSAEASLSDATNAYNKAVLAKQEYESALTTDMSAEVVAKSWEKVLAAGAGLWEGIKSLITDESWTDAYNRGYNETLSKITGDEIEYNDSGLQALADAEAEAKALMEQAQDRVELANQLTPETLESIYSSDEASGGNKTKEEVEEDLFKREMDYWENRIGANQARYEQLQNEIDLLEAKGQKADASYYEEQIKLEQQRLYLLEQQREKAKSFLGTFAEGSEEWWEVANTLNDLESELDDVTASIVDLQDVIGEIDAYKFEEFNNRLDDITNKISAIRDLIAPDSEEDWFDEQGNWTEEGVAVLGTYIQELETYKQGLEEAEAAYADYVKEYAGNEKDYEKLGIHSEQELYDKRQELIEQQYDYAQSISDTEQSIVDMYESNIDAVEEYINTLIDGYNDYIDSVKEALDAERDLYEFKKNVQKQSKDMADLERKIASLSGSTNASDIAERRKLEAQLYESRESLNDTYYDHARSAQDEALDAEQIAYEETMNKFIEGLRIGLESATANMDEFLMSVTSMVTLNADTVLAKYQETELPLGDAITNPWKAAIAKIGEYDGDALELMNKWTHGGFFDDYKTVVSSDLSSPWSAGSTAADAFKTNVSTVMEGVVSNISANVKTASGELSKLYQQIIDTENRADNIGTGNGGAGNGGGGDTEEDGADSSKPVYGPETPPKKPPTHTRPSTPTRPKFKKVGDLWSGVGHTGVSIGKKAYNKALEIEGDSGIFYPYTNGTGYKGYIKKGEGYTVLSNGKMDVHSMKPLYQKYAKGTTGTIRDEWAITDEKKFGDELVLVPGKDGNLSFMRKGTGVVPADMTQKLFELAQIPTSDLMNKNLTAIVPNITKNDFKNEFNFESLVHVDTVDSDTLPKLEKMIDKKIDDFSKALNYSIKKFAR